MSAISKPAGSTDILIVAGGSAGSVLATRLTQDPSRTVRLSKGGNGLSAGLDPERPHEPRARPRWAAQATHRPSSTPHGSCQRHRAAAGERRLDHRGGSDRRDRPQAPCDARFAENGSLVIPGYVASSSLASLSKGEGNEHHRYDGTAVSQV
jgi:choline dehydrogenase-like flavoprotein